MYRVLGALLLCFSCALAQDYSRDIEPLFQKRCSACHGAGQQLAGLRLDNADAVRKGSANGPVLVAGKPEESKLILRIASTKKGFAMPPAGQPLTEDEIALIRSWIQNGAKLPQTASAKHWSFEPIKRPQIPEVRQQAWIRSPIDAFVLAKLEKENTTPSPEASKRTLIRRLSLDLIGLPPKAAEIEEFVNDTRPDAYERLVERLLASPHYGEKWARHWLDLAHYADSDGYEKDLVRPYAWRYRNWIIDALNSDMPFDRFTIEQLAGDLLPNATTDQRVATAFYRQALTNREAGVDREEARFEQNINRTNTISTTWLGLTAGCAQCHNHKYDPISQKEFYQLFAFVDGLREQDIDAPLPGELGPYMRARPAFDRDRRSILDQHEVLKHQAVWEDRMREAVAKPGVNSEWDFVVTGYKVMVDHALQLLATPEAKRSRFDSERLTNYFLRNPGPDFNRNTRLITCLKDARAEMESLYSKFKPLTMAYVVTNNPDAPPTHMAAGGDYKVKGEVVKPGTPAILPPLPGKPNRLTLARWLVSRENPLTARVTVNRAWQEFFGRGLVRTSEDFGTQGERPTHPELLDWLASEFVERNWSMKSLHRTIVNSSTYRQSSKVRKELMDRDPDNSLLARQSRLRLQAELLRDTALSVSGLLDDRVGGPSIRPPLPAGVAELGYANNVKWAESTGPDRYRRGLYVHFQRTTPHPQLINFDAPNSNVTCSRRSRSNTPLQALNLLNDPVFFEAAQAFATRIATEAPPSARIEWAFEQALGRKPSTTERERLAKYVDQQSTVLKDKPRQITALLPFIPERTSALDAAVWAGVSRVLFNLDEFITRE